MIFTLALIACCGLPSSHSYQLLRLMFQQPLAIVASMPQLVAEPVQPTRNRKQREVDKRVRARGPRTPRSPLLATRNGRRPRDALSKTAARGARS